MRIATAAVVTAGLVLAAAPVLAKDSKDFLKQAIEGDTSEIMLGQMAQLRASSDGVREYGRALATDHAAAKDQAIALAQKIGLKPPDTPAKKAQSAQEKLSKLEGAEFDREFVSYMVKDHHDDIREFQEATRANDSPDVAQYAQMTLPKLQQHLEMAENLDRELKTKE
ncbi:MAG: DUF4142 domain-containing protein [Gemmatimonas sp.]